LGRLGNTVFDSLISDFKITFTYWDLWNNWTSLVSDGLQKTDRHLIILARPLGRSQNQQCFSFSSLNATTKLSPFPRPSTYITFANLFKYGTL